MIHGLSLFNKLCNFVLGIRACKLFLGSSTLSMTILSASLLIEFGLKFTSRIILCVEVRSAAWSTISAMFVSSFLDPLDTSQYMSVWNSHLIQFSDHIWQVLLDKVNVLATDLISATDAHLSHLIEFLRLGSFSRLGRVILA